MFESGIAHTEVLVTGITLKHEKEESPFEVPTESVSEGHVVKDKIENLIDMEGQLERSEITEAPIPEATTIPDLLTPFPSVIFKEVTTSPTEKEPSVVSELTSTMKTAEIEAPGLEKTTPVDELLTIDVDQISTLEMTLGTVELPSEVKEIIESDSEIRTTEKSVVSTSTTVDRVKEKIEELIGLEGQLERSEMTETPIPEATTISDLLTAFTSIHTEGTPTTVPEEVVTHKPEDELLTIFHPEHIGSFEMTTTSVELPPEIEEIIRSESEMETTEELVSSEEELLTEEHTAAIPTVHYYKTEFPITTEPTEEIEKVLEIEENIEKPEAGEIVPGEPVEEKVLTEGPSLKVVEILRTLNEFEISPESYHTESIVKEVEDLSTYLEGISLDLEHHTEVTHEAEKTTETNVPIILTPLLMVEDEYETTPFSFQLTSTSYPVAPEELVATIEVPTIEPAASIINEEDLSLVTPLSYVTIEPTVQSSVTLLNEEDLSLVTPLSVEHVTIETLPPHHKMHEKTKIKNIEENLPVKEEEQEVETNLAHLPKNRHETSTICEICDELKDLDEEPSKGLLKGPIEKELEEEEETVSTLSYKEIIAFNLHHTPIEEESKTITQFGATLSQKLEEEKEESEIVTSFAEEKIASHRVTELVSKSYGELGTTSVLTHYQKLEQEELETNLHHLPEHHGHETSTICEICLEEEEGATNEPKFLKKKPTQSPSHASKSSQSPGESEQGFGFSENVPGEETAVTSPEGLEVGTEMPQMPTESSETSIEKHPSVTYDFGGKEVQQPLQTTSGNVFQIGQYTEPESETFTSSFEEKIASKPHQAPEEISRTHGELKTTPALTHHQKLEQEEFESNLHHLPEHHGHETSTICEICLEEEEGATNEPTFLKKRPTQSPSHDSKSSQSPGESEQGFGLSENVPEEETKLTSPEGLETSIEKHPSVTSGEETEGEIEKTNIVIEVTSELSYNFGGKEVQQPLQTTSGNVFQIGQYTEPEGEIYTSSFEEKIASKPHHAPEEISKTHDEVETTPTLTHHQKLEQEEFDSNLLHLPEHHEHDASTICEICTEEEGGGIVTSSSEERITSKPHHVSEEITSHEKLNQEEEENKVVTSYEEEIVSKPHHAPETISKTYGELETTPVLTRYQKLDQEEFENNLLHLPENHETSTICEICTEEEGAQRISTPSYKDIIASNLHHTPVPESKTHLEMEVTSELTLLQKLIQEEEENEVITSSYEEKIVSKIPHEPEVTSKTHGKLKTTTVFTRYQKLEQEEFDSNLHHLPEHRHEISTICEICDEEGGSSVEPPFSKIKPTQYPGQQSKSSQSPGESDKGFGFSKNAEEEEGSTEVNTELSYNFEGKVVEQPMHTTSGNVFQIGQSIPEGNLAITGRTESAITIKEDVSTEAVVEEHISTEISESIIDEGLEAAEKVEKKLEEIIASQEESKSTEHFELGTATGGERTEAEKTTIEEVISTISEDAGAIPEEAKITSEIPESTNFYTEFKSTEYLELSSTGHETTVHEVPISESKNVPTEGIGGVLEKLEEMEVEAKAGSETVHEITSPKSEAEATSPSEEIKASMLVLEDLEERATTQIDNEVSAILTNLEDIQEEIFLPSLGIPEGTEATINEITGKHTIESTPFGSASTSIIHKPEKPVTSSILTGIESTVSVEGQEKVEASPVDLEDLEGRGTTQMNNEVSDILNKLENIQEKIFLSSLGIEESTVPGLIGVEDHRAETSEKEIIEEITEKSIHVSISHEKIESITELTAPLKEHEQTVGVEFKELEEHTTPRLDTEVSALLENLEDIQEELFISTLESGLITEAAEAGTLSEEPKIVEVETTAGGITVGEEAGSSIEAEKEEEAHIEHTTPQENETTGETTVKSHIELMSTHAEPGVGVSTDFYTEVNSKHTPSGEIIVTNAYTSEPHVHEEPTTKSELPHSEEFLSQDIKNKLEDLNEIVNEILSTTPEKKLIGEEGEHVEGQTTANSILEDQLEDLNKGFIDMLKTTASAEDLLGEYKHTTNALLEGTFEELELPKETTEVIEGEHTESHLMKELYSTGETIEHHVELSSVPTEIHTSEKETLVEGTEGTNPSHPSTFVVTSKTALVLGEEEGAKPRPTELGGETSESLHHKVEEEATKGSEGRIETDFYTEVISKSTPVLDLHAEEVEQHITSIPDEIDKKLDELNDVVGDILNSTPISHEHPGGAKELEGEITESEILEEELKELKKEFEEIHQTTLSGEEILKELKVTPHITEELPEAEVAISTEIIGEEVSSILSMLEHTAAGVTESHPETTIHTNLSIVEEEIKSESATAPEVQKITNFYTDTLTAHTKLQEESTSHKISIPGETDTHISIEGTAVTSVEEEMKIESTSAPEVQKVTNFYTDTLTAQTELQEESSSHKISITGETGTHISMGGTDVTSVEEEMISESATSPEVQKITNFYTDTLTAQTGLQEESSSHEISISGETESYTHIEGKTEGEEELLTIETLRPTVKSVTDKLEEKLEELDEIINEFLTSPSSLEDVVEKTAIELEAGPEDEVLEKELEDLKHEFQLMLSTTVAPDNLLEAMDEVLYPTTTSEGVHLEKLNETEQSVNPEEIHIHPTISEGETLASQEGELVTEHSTVGGEEVAISEVGLAHTTRIVTSGTAMSEAEGLEEITATEGGSSEAHPAAIESEAVTEAIGEGGTTSEGGETEAHPEATEGGTSSIRSEIEGTHPGSKSTERTGRTTESSTSKGHTIEGLSSISLLTTLLLSLVTSTTQVPEKTISSNVSGPQNIPKCLVVFITGESPLLPLNGTKWVPSECPPLGMQISSPYPPESTTPSSQMSTNAETVVTTAVVTTVGTTETTTLVPAEELPEIKTSNFIEDGCTETDFENNNKCFCMLDVTADKVAEDLEATNSSKTNGVKCSKFLKVSRGLVLRNDTSARLKRSRRSYLYLRYLNRQRRETVEYNKIDEVLANELTATSTDTTIYSEVGSTATIPCVYKDEVIEREHFMKYLWSMESDKTIIFSDRMRETTDGALKISEVTVEDDGNYTCSINRPFGGNADSSERRRFAHQLLVIDRPIFKVRSTVMYVTDLPCTLKDGDVVHAHLPKMLEDLLCGIHRRVCKVEMERPSCVEVEEKTYLTVKYIVTLDSLSNLVPSLSSSDCDFNCQMKLMGSMVSLLIKNVETTSVLDVLSEIETFNHTFKPREVKFPTDRSVVEDSSLLPKLVIGCPPGFGIQKRSSKICVACPRNTYNSENSSACTPCPSVHYQPKVGSSSCIECKTPFDDKACMGMMFANKSFLILYVGSSVAIVFFLLLCIFCAQSSTQEAFGGPQRKKKAQTPKRRRIGRKDVEDPAEKPLLPKDPSVPRIVKGPKVPPPDF
ncbi:uncharacterized protein LOC123683051 isoform X2 [Harmonia axyridis]|uniref:uncharacterized protein LOC123683051 isoform X2 n=1 Tax=Harmonia axyridis TaxID=115357 RepID=UPI001E278624|nr:uncharacterized protein LOC123683051 isoform X2 [Harmonia axyridis]